MQRIDSECTATAVVQGMQRRDSRSCLRLAGSAAAHDRLRSGTLAVIAGQVIVVVVSQAVVHMEIRLRARLAAAAGRHTAAAVGAGTRQAPAPASAAAETSGKTSWPVA